MEDKYITFNFNGKKINSHVRIYNQKKENTLLALHGLGSDASESFDIFANYGPKDYRIVAPDWIGSGETSKPIGEKDYYDTEYCTSWLEKFIANAQNQEILNERFSIYGISMAALGIAELYPRLENSIDKIILQNPAGLDKKIDKRFAFVLGSGLMGPKITKKIANNGWLWRHTFGWSEEKKRRLKKDLKNGGLEFSVILKQANNGFTLWGNMKEGYYIPDKFDKMNKAILLIYGENDSLFYEQKYLTFAKTKANWQIKMIEGAEHSIVDKDLEKVGKAIEEFLYSEIKTKNPDSDCIAIQ